MRSRVPRSLRHSGEELKAVWKSPQAASEFQEGGWASPEM